ncbi:MAG TPA: phosphopantetheine-binding protein [Jiangellales bacterium]|nr:phosphopantetheine-binding protein [Jiangellales bacterium]
MTPDKARELMREALRQVAPDADFDTLPATTSLRDDLELDSLDFENLVTQLSERSGHRIDEDDYPKLITVGDCVDYLAGLETSHR